MKAVVMAGGTGGHVFPALAVAEALRVQGHEIAWMGSDGGMETTLVPRYGFPLHRVPVRGLRGGGVLRLLLAPLTLLRAVWQALRILRRERPSVVLGMGGFAAGPGGIAAALLRRPLVVHEQNAAAGLTNRWLARIATRVLQAFPNTLPRAETVGNPVRAAFAVIPEPAQRLGGRQGAVRLLVVGGSQGARALNLGVPAALARMPDLRFAVRHQGGRTVADAHAAYAAAGRSAEIVEFIDDMAAAYEWADLVVCRAGAMTVAEIAAAGVAAIFVPFPAAVDDHQARNADHLVQAGAAVLLRESEMRADTLAALLARHDDRQRLLAMAEAARAAAKPHSCDAIVAACLEVAKP